jgi:hypothetical protein
MLHKTGFRQSLLLIVPIFALCVSGNSTFAQRRTEPAFPKLNYEAVPNFFQLPPGENFVEACGIAVNSKGHIYVFHRGKHPLMEFDSGKWDILTASSSPGIILSTCVTRSRAAF